MYQKINADKNLKKRNKIFVHFNLAFNYLLTSWIITRKISNHLIINWLFKTTVWENCVCSIKWILKCLLLFIGSSNFSWLLDTTATLRLIRKISLIIWNSSNTFNCVVFACFLFQDFMRFTFQQWINEHF